MTNKTTHICMTITAALVAAVLMLGCAMQTPGDSAGEAASYAPLSGSNPCPAVIPSIQEWEGGDGKVTVQGGNLVSIKAGELANAEDGQIRYDLVDDESLGEEGYRIDIGCASAEDENGIRVYAQTETGLRWGNITLQQMIVLAEDEEYADGGETAQSTVHLVRGRIYDYPVGKVRGLMLDVGRNTMSLHQIYEIAQNLSWYKMNELQLHLQDNALLTYSDKTDHVSTAYEAYSAYRMESEITNAEGQSITAEDLSYSAEDFARLITDCAAIGVSIIPEIDTPAHSLALTSAFPDYGLSARPDSVDMLDCSQEEALELACRVWDEQLETAFADATTIQIGGDEYYGQAVDFVSYEQGLIDHLSGSGKTLRLWGSLTALKGDHEISPTLANGETIQMQLWSTYWADPEEMYAAGFDLINSSSDKLYINCGEASDYLDKENLYNNYTRTEYAMADGSTETLPESDQLIGSCAALWNDLVDNLEIGISEYDMTDRVLDALPVLGEVFWNENGPRAYADFASDAEVIGLARGSDPYDQGGGDLQGPPYTVSFSLFLPNDILLASKEERTIFEAARDGNTYALYICEDGRLGFSREFYDYAFDYEVPRDEEVRITLHGEKDTTTLYVNGELVQTLGSANAYEEHATFVFPMTVHEAFIGQVEWLTGEEGLPDTNGADGADDADVETTPNA